MVVNGLISFTASLLVNHYIGNQGWRQSFYNALLSGAAGALLGPAASKVGGLFVSSLASTVASKLIANEIFVIGVKSVIYGLFNLGVEFTQQTVNHYFFNEPGYNGNKLFAAFVLGAAAAIIGEGIKSVGDFTELGEIIFDAKIGLLAVMAGTTYNAFTDAVRGLFKEEEIMIPINEH